MNEVNVGVLGVGSYLPERVLTNVDLEKMMDTNNEWIVTRTGIEERRIASDIQATSDLAKEAALIAMARANVKPTDIDLIIVATLTPDHLFPSTACILQDKIKANNAAAFDLSAACSGFIYAVATGTQFIKSGLYKKVLVVGAETITKILDWEDRATAVLFGDGAGAVVLGAVSPDKGFHSFVLGSDGAGANLLTQPAGGSSIPTSKQSVEDKLHFLKMNGNEVFKFAVRAMGQAAEQAVEKAKLDKEDIDFFIPHQANIRIIEPAVKRLGLSMDKVYINLQKYGNMSAASIPVALDEAIQKNAINKGDKVLLVGFGAGLTWGATVFTL